ncbi:TetR/AcrR family transcriptional regulator [Streptomyces sparsogenes]
MKEPQQDRSRRSAQQILTAAVEMLTESGIADFTMTGVSRSAGLSIGGVYGRFPNREALLREVKDDVLTELEEEVRSRAEADPGDLRSTLTTLVTTLAEALHTRSRLFAFVFLHSADDPAMRRRGFVFHERMKNLFRDALGRHGESISRDRTTAVDVLYEVVVQSLISRTITEGSSPEGETTYAGIPPWRTYAAHVAEMSCLYLTIPTPVGAPPGEDHDLH